MPVRSLRSSVLKWLDRRAVDAAVLAWAKEAVEEREDILRIGLLRLLHHRRLGSGKRPGYYHYPGEI